VSSAIQAINQRFESDLAEAGRALAEPAFAAALAEVWASHPELEELRWERVAGRMFTPASTATLRLDDVMALTALLRAAVPGPQDLLAVATPAGYVMR
jgi:hypothetical protein